MRWKAVHCTGWMKSEADIFMSSPGKSDEFVLPSQEEEKSMRNEEDIE